MNERAVLKEGEAVAREARKQALGYITAGLGLVAGLAWNDAIKALIAWAFPLESSTLIAKFLYAVIITLVVVTVSVILIRRLKADE